MSKTKEQLYNELKELTEENRKQIKEILDDIVESGILSTLLVKIPKCQDLCNQYEITKKELVNLLEDYLNKEVELFVESCTWRRVTVQLSYSEDSNFYEVIKVTLCPETENTFLDDLFYFRSLSYTEVLKDFVEGYLEHSDAFTEYLCANDFISADIYSEGFYDLVTVKELSPIFAEYENFFKDELDKLKGIITSLYECGDKLNKITDTFEQDFSNHLENFGFERKH